MKRDIPDIHEFAASERISLPRIMDFTTTANPLGPSAKARNAVRKNVKIMDRRPDGKARYLVRAIARTEGVPEENILVGESFETLVAAVLNTFEARTVLRQTPYPAYHRELTEDPAGFTFFPLDKNDRFSLDLAAWDRQMRHCDAAILACPSFVSAGTPSREAVAGIISEAGERGTLLIIDETLKGYSGAPSFAADTLKQDRCLVMGSLTEYYALAGLPVSYAIGRASMIEDIRRRSSIIPPNTLAAAAAVESLRDGAYPLRTRSFMKREAAFIEESLRGIPGISFFTTVCGFFVVTLIDSPSKPLETFRRYRIVIDDLGDTRTLFFPVKDHKWNARYLKTLKNIMGASKQ
jgi:threonine-phosphate decarboxylase